MLSSRWFEFNIVIVIQDTALRRHIVTNTHKSSYYDVDVDDGNDGEDAINKNNNDNTSTTTITTGV